MTIKIIYKSGINILILILLYSNTAFAIMAINKSNPNIMQGVNPGSQSWMTPTAAGIQKQSEEETKQPLSKNGSIYDEQGRLISTHYIVNGFDVTHSFQYQGEATVADTITSHIRDAVSGTLIKTEVKTLDEQGQPTDDGTSTTYYDDSGRISYNHYIVNGFDVTHSFQYQGEATVADTMISHIRDAVSGDMIRTEVKTFDEQGQNLKLRQITSYNHQTDNGTSTTYFDENGQVGHTHYIVNGFDVTNYFQYQGEATVADALISYIRDADSGDMIRTEVRTLDEQGQNPVLTIVEEDTSFSEFNPPVSSDQIEVSGQLAAFLNNSLGIYGPVGIMTINHPPQEGELTYGNFFISDQDGLNEFVFSKAQELGYSMEQIQNMSAKELIELANIIVSDTMEYGTPDFSSYNPMDLNELAKNGIGSCTHYAGFFVGVFNSLKSVNGNAANVYANIFNDYHHLFVRITTLSMEDGKLHISGTYVDPTEVMSGGNTFSFDRYAMDTTANSIFEAGLYQMIGYDDLAITKYQELTTNEDPKVAFNAFFALASLHIQNGDNDKAGTYLDQAFELLKTIPENNPKMFLVLSIAATNVSEFNLSIEIGNVVQAQILNILSDNMLDPHLKDTWQAFLCESYLNEADCYYELGNYTRALAEYNNVIDNYPISDLYSKDLWIYQKALNRIEEIEGLLN